MIQDEWKDQALCKGSRTSDYFPVRITRENIDTLTEIFELCEKCKVNAECLESAIVNEELGVWGRTTLRQRKQFIKNILDKKISNLTLEKCKDFISFLTKNNIKPSERAYKLEITD